MEAKHLYISQLQVKNFRAFSEEEDKEYTFPLGKHITCIAGHNGIGKSTLLAMLGNCGELKVSKGRHLNGTAFRGEYSQIIKGDKNFDTTGDKCRITFADLPSKQNEDIPYIEELEFRATFQAAKKKSVIYTHDKKSDLYHQEEVQTSYTRYRLIPKKTEARQIEKKIDWPTFYLGLSRLYPVGEADDTNSKAIDKEILSKLVDHHKMILSSSDEYNGASTVKISDTDKKRGFGINTGKYNAVANSSGQDNIGQILLTVYSFENLKNQLKDEYLGGLFLIDELDATLHPSAQNKLFDFLYKKSKELNLQIVFTTHSLSLLQHILTTHELKEKNKSLSLLYLTNARNRIEVSHNPAYRLIQNDLLSTYSGATNKIQIPIMTEDDVARWFLKNILSLKNCNYSINYLNNKLGWEQIVDLVIGDYNYFRNQITILDPDIMLADNIEKIIPSLKGSRYKFNTSSSKFTTEILCLPGNKAVEEIFWIYLSTLAANDPFFYDPEIEESGLTHRALMDKSPSTYPGEKGLPQIKKWFEDHQWVADIAFKYWAKDNAEIILAFENSFNAEYNKIATRMGMRTVVLAREDTSVQET